MKLPKWLVNFLAKIFPHHTDTPETKLFKRTSWTILGMIGLFVLIFLAAFFFALEGEEETMVPRVIGSDLVTALQELQDKELVARIQTRPSTDPRDKGTILAQDPSPGSLVKAGRKVLITVSRGAVIDKVKSYVGMSVDVVRLNLQTLFATSKPLLRIKEPLTYVYHSSEPGTILEQKPKADTEIFDLTDLEFVVSRGPQGQVQKVAQFVGLSWQEAVKQSVSLGQPVAFKARNAAGAEGNGQVVTQDPVAKVETAKGKVIELIMTNPGKLADGQIFGIFDTSLPTYEILVDLKLILTKSNGDKVTLLSMNHPGGHFAYPYLAQSGDTISLEIVGKVMDKKLVE